MSEYERELVDVALALNEFEISLDSVEGALLMAAGKDEPITASILSERADSPLQTAKDILLQLRRVDCVTQSVADDSLYAVDPDRVREVCTTARQAQAFVTRYEERQPDTTSVTPLVTIPEDPELGRLTAEEFGMDWLMPALVRMIKRADRKIIILTPFFEGDGLDRLEEPLLEAVGNGVEVTIVTRYLQDTTSYNHEVLTNFWATANEAGVDTELLSLVDYTVWSEETPPEKRGQDGTTPLYTLHAKMVIVDGEEAYVGSANVTDYGFARFLELGVALTGPAVRSYTMLANRVLDSDSAVPWEPG
jgi:putative cardiolipin synthase